MRKLSAYSKVIFFVVLLILLSQGYSQALTLVENCKSNYTIVISNEASLTEHHGAQELQMYLQMISGCYIPILQDVQEPTGPMILVGRSNKLQQIDSSIDYDKLGNEGFVVKTVGENIILTGGKLRGTMYAVYSFLEDVLGCRWYTPECSVIPKKSTITLQSLNSMQKPAFKQRDVFWDIAKDADWSARNRVTSASSDLDIQRGGKVILNGVHTLNGLLSHFDYWEDHPEYFSIQSSGKREWKRSQLCLTNPEVVKILAYQTIQWIKREPDSYAYFVAQNDGYGECYCSHCDAIYKEEGSCSATYVHCANKVAEQTEKLFPDKYIGTLAYRFTEVPPSKTKPGKNVIIRLCNIQGCDAHPLTDCDRNIDFVKNLRGWASITNNIYIWDYLTNFHNYIQPHPNWYAMNKDLQFFRKLGVQGLFLQTCVETEGAANEDMAAWVQAKLLWNPDLDVNELMNEFIAAYYGPAAEPMRAFYNLFVDNVLNDWIHFDLYFPPTGNYLRPDIIQKAEDHLKEAERLAVHDAKAAYRVEEAKIGIRYVKLLQPRQHVLEGNVLKPSPLTPRDVNLRELKDFMETCDKHEITSFTEGRGQWVRYNEMRANISEHRVVTIENPDIKVEVVPSFGGGIYRILYKKANQNILEITPPERNGYPSLGGYQEYPVLAEIFDYSIEKVPEGSKIVLEGYLNYNKIMNAFHYTREILIPDEKPIIKITSRMEALEDVADFDRPRYISPSLNLAIGPVWKLRTGWQDKNEKFSMFSMPEPVTGRLIKTERTYPAVQDFYTKNLERGVWIAFNAEDRIGVINRFQLDEVERCTIDAGRTNPHIISMSIQSVRKPMTKGEVINLQYSYEIVEEIPAR